MSMNFPFESMSRAISAPSVLVGAELLSDGCCWCCAGALDTGAVMTVSCLGRISLGAG